MVKLCELCWVTRVAWVVCVAFNWIDLEWLLRQCRWNERQSSAIPIDHSQWAIVHCGIMLSEKIQKGSSIISDINEVDWFSNPRHRQQEPAFAIQQFHICRGYHVANCQWPIAICHLPLPRPLCSFSLSLCASWSMAVCPEWWEGSLTSFCLTKDISHFLPHPPTYLHSCNTCTFVCLNGMGIG